MIAASICGALPFRPHVWITGGTNTGKTALLELLFRVFPSCIRLDGESTEAAVRQEVGSSSMPILMDEMEGWQGRSRVLRLLRSGTRGGAVVKGTPSGRPIRYIMRSMVFFASIESDLRRDADRNRYVLFDLAPSQLGITIPSPESLRQLGMQLLGAAIANASRIVVTFEALSKDPRFTRHGRLAETHAVGVAVRASFREWSYDDAATVLEAILGKYTEAMDERYEPESSALLRDIVTSTPRTAGAAMNVGDMLRTKDRRHCLNTQGISLVRRDTAIFVAPEVIQRSLLAGTRWVNINIRDILMRFEGAKASRHRVAGGNIRGVELPIALFELGSAIG